MKRRLLSAAVAVCMLLTLLPAGVWAAEPEGASLPAGREYSIKLDYPVENSAVSAKFADAAGMSAANGLSGEDTPGLLAAGGYATWEDAGNAAVEGEDYTLSYDDSVCTIYTARGLAKIANYVDSMETSFIGWTVRLGNDIDLTTAGVIGYGKDTVTETNSWDPIGGFEFDYSTGNVTIIPFQGVFDGDGYKVQNLYINSSLSSTGLFSCVFTDMTRGGEQVVIKDVTIEGADITGNFMANSFLVGFLSEAIITDCTVDETSVLTIPGNQVQMNGGFVGGAQTSGLNLGGELYIKNCVNNGTISGGMLTGGIAGATGQKLLNCTNNGSVSAGSTQAGGIVGYYQEQGGIAPFEILDCVNNGDVSSEFGWAGGIAGQVVVSSETSLIARCYNTGSVIGGAEVGGIAGGIDNGEIADCYNTGAVSAHEADSSDLGGIAGYLDPGSITNCYNIGSITNGAAASTGGVVGENNGTVTGCFYLEGTAAADFGGSTALSVQQLAEQSTFTDEGWDFETTWGMSGLLGRPVLQTVPEAQGSGAQDDPIEIPDLETLERFRDKVNGGNSYEGMYVKLAADIDLSEKYGADVGGEEVSWTPIGSSGDPFKGSFDGGDFEISGLYINSTQDEQGLFRSLAKGGTIKNLQLSGTVIGGSYIGGLAGRNAGTVDNCQSAVSVSGTMQAVGGLIGMNNGAVLNSKNTGSVSGMINIGGVIGYNGNNCQVENCVNTGNVNGTVMYTGGVAGINNGGIISGCENSGTISGASYAGGVAGHTVSVTAGADADAVIENCHNTGAVSGTNGIGGVVGAIGNADSVVSDCYNKGSVSSMASGSAAGGIAGYNNGILSNCRNESADGSSISSAADEAMVGGIAGGNSYTLQNSYNMGAVSATGANASSGGVAGANYVNGATGVKGSVNHCYNTGAVSGGTTGGVVGDNQDGATAANCYYNNEIYTAEDATEGVTGKTAAQFASGEVAYLLQGGQTAGDDGAIPQVWGQTLAGAATDASPVLTADERKAVYKVAFMTAGEQDGAYTEYAAAYANPNGTVTLPQAPDSEVYDFVKWSQTASADGAEFTDQTAVTGDMTVYAIGQEMFGETDDEKTITTIYGIGATQDLSDYMAYAGETDAAGKFTYAVTNSASANGNTLSASITGDTLTIPADTDADTYTLTITATEKTPVIVPFSVEYGTEPVTLEVTVVVEKADPIYDLPDNLTATYGQTLINVSLPEGFTWQNPAESVGDAGTNTFKAIYTPADTENYNTAEVEITFTVEKADVTVALNTENPQGAGENRSIDLVASVTGVTGGEVPTGTVVFYDGDTAISEGIVIADGKAAFTWTQIPVGEHSLKAVYSGSANYQTAEGTASYNLDKDVQTELTIAGPDTVVYGDKPFTLTVSGGSGTGAVSYAVAGESIVYDETTGTFTVVKTGESTITITKAADENYNEATAVLTITVNPAAPVLAEGAKVTAERVRRGNSLSTSEITGTVSGLDGQPLDGAWAWKTDHEMDETGTFEEMAVFAPKNTNYAPFETVISVTVYQPSSGGEGTIRYTVTFDTQGGSKIASVRVINNRTVAKPEEPSREGYNFEGWFTDKDCTEAYDFDTKITEDITLYAKWTEESETEPVDPEPTPEPDEWENPFNDVSEDDWYYEDVKFAEKTGLFHGETETTFAPNKAVTRGMLVTVLWRAEEQPVVNYLMTFADVAQDAYYAEAVRWAASEGIITGYSETEYAPEKLVSREEMAAIMNRYAEYKGADTGVRGDLIKFADQAQIADWARENVSWAIGYGLLSGRENGVLDPQGTATRAEVAAILNRFLEK